MGDLSKGFLLWGLAGVLTWSFWSIFISAKSKIGFIDADRVAYRKGLGTVVEKGVIQTRYELQFTYPEGDNRFRSRLPVSHKEFDMAQIGHKIPILYGIHFPHLWMPIKSGKVYYISIVLIVVAAVLFLMGAFPIYRAICLMSGHFR
jgi:hypothetical protein